MCQPFAFLVSESPQDPPSTVWLCSFKDLRPQGGRLHFGRGLGPVSAPSAIVDLVAQMIERGLLAADEVKMRLGI